MAIWTACGKHTVLCWSQSAVKTCWIGKVCSLQIRLTDVRMICVHFYTFTLDTAQSAVAMGPRDKSSVWNCTTFVSGATRMSQDCRNSVFEQPTFIVQYHDLAQKITSKPRATIFLHYLTNYIPRTFLTKQSHKIILSLLLWSCPKPWTAFGPLSLALCWEDRAQVTKFFGSSPFPSRGGGQGGPAREKIKNKDDSVVRKMAAGRKCHQHDKSLSRYISCYRERQARQARYVTLRHVRVTTVTEEKQ